MPEDLASTNEQLDFEPMLVDPSSFFASPQDVARDAGLTVEQKIRLLERWEEDARRLLAAEEESMTGGEPNLLDSVLQALGSLRAGPNPENRDVSAASPTSDQRRQRLTRKIYHRLMQFPERIDEMEIRSERACWILAARIAELLDEDRS